MKEANEQALVAVMMEDREAVENIEAIAAVEGIDVFNLVIPRSLLRGRALYKQGGWKKGRTEAV